MYLNVYAQCRRKTLMLVKFVILKHPYVNETETVIF